MGMLYDFYCPHCFKHVNLPNNTTGRYGVMMGVVQVLVNKKTKKFEHLLLPHDCNYEIEGEVNSRCETVIQNFLKYGIAEYFTEDEAKERELTEQNSDFVVWKNVPKYWKCPCCRHRMFRTSELAILVD